MSDESSKGSDVGISLEELRTSSVDGGVGNRGEEVVRKTGHDGAGVMSTEQPSSGGQDSCDSAVTPSKRDKEDNEPALRTPGGEVNSQRAPLREPSSSKSMGPATLAQNHMAASPEKKGILSKWGADYDLPTMPRSTAVMKKEETAQVVKNLGVAMNLLLDVTSGGGDPQAPARGKRKKKAAPGPAVKRGDDELIPEDQDVMRADPSPKEVDMQRLKTDRSVETLRKELDTMYDRDKENLLQEYWTTYEFLMKKKQLQDGEDVEGLILLQKVRMVEVSLLGDEEVEGEEDVQVSRFEISHIENDEIMREMRGEEVSLSSSVVGGTTQSSQVYVEELGQNFTATGMPICKQEEKSTSVMVQRLKRMEKIVASSMRDRLGEMKAMEQDIVRLERELEERKLALQESRQSVNYFRKDMVRLQVTVEDIDSQIRNLTMNYTAVDIKRAGKNGFEMHMDNSVACFVAPKGPVMLISARMPRENVLRWRVRVSGNASWALGVIPEDEIDNPMFFFTGLRVGVNSKDTTRSSLLPRENVHGLWVEIVVDVKRKHVLIRAEGRLKMEIRQIHDYDTNVRLALCCFLNCVAEICTV